MSKPGNPTPPLLLCIRSGHKPEQIGIIFQQRVSREPSKKYVVRAESSRNCENRKIFRNTFRLGSSKKDMFAWILARVNSKLESWKENLLSRAGKETLLKSVVQAIPQYAMSIFKSPVSIIKAIEKKIANFWWRNTNKTAGIHWRKWSLLKLRKQEGGLGFKDLLAFNTAMLGKQAWRISQYPNSLWGQLMKGLYFSSCNFWNAGKGSCPSWG